MTLDSRLKEIKERCEAATEGPWHHNDCTGVWYGEKEQTDKKKSLFIAATSHDPNDNWPQPDALEQMKTAKFIAHARTDVPMLLEIIETLLNAPDANLEYLSKDWFEKIAEKYQGFKDQTYNQRCNSDV